MHGDAIRASVNTQLGMLDNIGNGRVPTISDKRDFVEINAEIDQGASHSYGVTVVGIEYQ